MEPLDLYIMALQNQIDKLKAKDGFEEDSVVYQTIKACLELAIDIKKEVKNGNNRIL